jgi:hypothetical protein
MTADMWYDDPDTVWSVAAYAHDQGQLCTAKEVLDFFEKPHHYGDLHYQWAYWGYLVDKADR